MSAQTPDATEAEDDFDLSDVNGRMCIVTRESGSPETLLRFVAAPDGTIVPDLARRLRTLYKSCDFDDRAIDDLAALGDESLRLRAEEAVKRLAEEPETAAVRRKVGGLPAGLAIFELGFAGKGRVYYVRNERGGFRILAVGGKATQKQDLEYLSRLS